MGTIVVNGVTKTVSAGPGEVYYEGSTAYIVMPDNAGFASSPTQSIAPASTPITTANVVSNSAPGFDPDFYKAQNPDVAASGVDPLNHFRTLGWKEGRDPNPYFDTKGYLATYVDVKASGINPLDHYNNNGWREGRDPSAWFDTSSYLDANPDVKAAGVNPLQHFLANGQFEGRLAIPQVVDDTNGTANIVHAGATNGSATGLTVSWGNWQTTTYAIATDPSGGGFAINPTTGVVTVADPSKLTPGAFYALVVRSVDDGHSILTTFGLAIEQGDLTPVITSDGGGATASRSVAENTTAVTTVTSTDPDGPTPTYSIVGGANSAKFTINASTGQLSFLAAPNFEAPTDSDTNNTYIVTVRASDGTLNDDQTITVTVTDVNAAPVFTSGTTGSIAENSSAATVVYDANATDDGENSNTLTYSFGGGADDGMFIINPTTGEVRFAVSPNFEAPADAGDNNVYNIIVRASDGTATTDRAVAITVTNVNETPVASDASFSASEDIAYNGAVPAASDGDGNPLTYAVVGGSAVGGSVVVNTNGTFTFTPTANFNGNATFQYVANDGTVNSAPKTVTINFAAVNDVPVADADGPYAIGEDGTLTVNAAGGVLAGDVDIDSGGLIATLLSGPGHATAFSLNTDGSFSYTPLANFSGADTFVYRAFAGGAFSDPIVVTINVTAANDAPVAASASFSATEDVAYNGAVPAATDAEGSALTYTVVGGTVVGGSVVLLPNGTFTFTPTANFNGAASFQYVANDGSLNSAAQTITLNFGAINDAPVALDGTLAASEDGGAVMIDVASLISDVETADAGLTVTASVSPSEGTVSVLGTVITFTPAANFNGAASITYTVSDGGPLSDTATIAVTVAAANDAPVAVGSTLSASEDAASVQITLSASDIDAGDAVTSFTLGTLPTSGTFYSDAALTLAVGTGSVVTATGGAATIYFKPNANFNGPVTFNYTASDGDNSSAAATVTINVAAINDAPVALDGTLSASEDGGPVTIDVASLVSDVETADAGLTVTASVPASQGTVSVLGTVITFTPAANFNGAASISYTVSDGTLTDSATIAVTVAADDDAPVAVTQTVTGIEDQVLEGRVTATDIDGGSATFSGTGTTANGGSYTVNADGSYTYTPAANFNGADSFTFQVSNGSDPATIGTVNITIGAVNDAPAINAPDTSGTPVELLANGSFESGTSAETFLSPGSTAITGWSVINGNVYYNENLWQDGEGTRSVNIAQGTNPGGIETTLTTVIGQTYTVEFEMAGNWFYGDNHTARVAAGATSQDFNFDSTGRSNSDMGWAPRTFTFTATSATTTLQFTTISGSPVIDSVSVDDPTANQPLSVTEDTAFGFAGPAAITISDVDAASSNLTVTLHVGNGMLTAVAAGGADVDGGGTGTLTITGTVTDINSTLGSLAYTPDGNFNGADALIINVNDGGNTGAGGALSATRTVSLNVAAVNDAPVAVANTTYVTAEDAPLVLAVLGNDTDVDGPFPLAVARINSAPVSVGQTVAVTGGTVTVNADGTLTFSPTANSTTDGAFTYTVKDGAGLEGNTVNVAVDVTPVNDAPVALDGTLAASEDGGAVTIDVASLISDVETADAGLTVTASVSPSEGTVSVLGTVITFTPVANFNGAASITYTVSDGALSDAGTIAVTVAAANDAPVAVGSTLSASEDAASVQITLSASDIDAGDAVTSFTLGTLPTSGTFYSDAALTVAVGTGSVVTATGGAATIYFKPNANFNGPVTFNYTASDGDNSSAAATVTINVAAINDAPVALDGVLAASEDGGAVTIDVASLVSDVETADVGLTVTASVPASQGTVSVLGTVITFTPAANFNGAASISYTVSDGTLSDTATIAVTVAADDDAPVAVTQTVTGIEDQVLEGRVTATDIDGGSATFSGTGTTANGGSYTVNADGSYTYTPAANFNGADSFTFQVSNGSDPATIGTVNITIGAVNDAPVANADIGTAPTSLAGFSTNEDTSVILNVLANDTDIESGTPSQIGRINGTPVLVGSVVNVNGGQVTVNADWTLTFAPTPNSTQDGSFTYTAKDSSGAESGQATVVVDVIAVNDPPVVDLNGATAGVDRADLPTYTSGAAAINVATAIAAVTDTENAVSKITLTLTADVGSPDGSPAEGLTLPAGVAATLGLIGFTVTGEGTNTIEIISNTAGGISPAVFENILKTVLYHDNDQTFGFNAQDRTITVTATDGSGLASAPALVHIDLAANVTDVNGVGSAVNTFTGANLADTIRGNDGNDTMEGAGGDDQIYGGTEAGDSGLDTANFTGNRADYTVTRTGPGVYTVADSVSGRDGTDTVHDVETLHFANLDLQLDAPIQVFNPAGNVLLASFQANELDLAVSYANTQAGANVVELRSSASPFTSSAWPATITEAVTIKAVGGTATINAGANSGIAIAASAVLGATDTVRLEGLNITGNGTTDTVGVVFSGAYEGLSDGAIQIVNTSVSGFGQNGVAIIGGGPGLSVTIDGDNPATIGTTETSTFTGSGGSTTSGGSGDLLFFAFTGAAALKNIVVTGTTVTSDNGIQFAGYDGGDHSVDHAIGAVTFQNVAVNGTYEKTLVYVQGYDNLSALGFAGGLTLGNGASAATWTALFIDGGPQGGGYIPSGAIGGAIDGTINLTGVSVSGGTYGTSPGFAVLGGKQIVVNGTLTDDLITGTLANEAFIGLAGDDTINAGGGNDLILHNVGDGHDTVDGQGNTDTLGLINFNGTVPSATPANFAISESGGHLIVQTDGIGAAEVDAAGMESVQATLGNGGDTVTLTGNIAGAGIATGPGGIVVTGGTSGDTLDASGLGSASAITFSNLGGGNDTFKAANVIANDVVDGGGGAGDTADYSAAGAAVTIDLQAGTASGTSVGSDTIANYENATGGAFNDNISGTTGANTLSGGAGDDTLTGRGGNDILVGGETGETHGDTAAYAGPITAGMIATNGSGGWTVTSGVTEGTDTLSEIEVVQGANPPGLPTGKFLLVGNGGYATIAAAYLEAVDGDTIVLAAGTYAGDFTIDKAISVVGANYNVNGTGARGAESILTGHWTINAASGPVTIDGVEFLNSAAWTSGTNDTRLMLASEATVAHSVFYNTRPGGNKPISDVGINVTAATGTVSIFDNMFSGDHHGKYFAPLNGSAADPASASWGGGTTAGGNAGAIVWSGGATLDVDGNTIKYARTALNLTGDDAKLTINDNDFVTNGTAVTATGWSGAVNSVTINTFSDVDNEFNLRSNVAGINIDLAGNSSDNWFSVLGTTGADIINGTSGKDAVVGEDGDDTVHTAGGNDAIYFNSGATAGNDKVDGGSETGKDTLVVSNTSAVNTTIDPGDAGEPATTVVGSPGGTKTTFNMTVTGDAVTATNGTNSLNDISIVAQTTVGATSLGSVVADEIEDVQFNLGTNGDTVNISGNFSTTSLATSTITINGGNGDDTVDARTLSSAHKIVFNGGDGDDTFKASNTTANDIISAGANGANGDTVDYSAATSSVTINLADGTASGTSIGSDTVMNFENAIGGSDNDTIIGTGGNNAISGGGGIDTVTTTSPSGYGAGYHLEIQSGHWVVTNGTNTDTLTGVERVVVNGTTYLLVDKLGANGGFHQVQDAVNFASGGETILIAPGTYTEIGNPTSQPGNLGGLYINKANLTLQGVHADGSPITTAADAKLLGATIVAGEENNFGANHWVDFGGDNTVFNGVHLKAGDDTSGKLLEIWAENVTVQNSFVDVYTIADVYTFAVAIYINDNGSAATDEVTKYTINGNILNEGIIVANGVGDPSAGIGALQKITNNAFEGVFDYNTGEGRYDTVALNGQVVGTPWLLESTQIPTISGNTFANNTTPFLLRGSDNDAAKLPSAAQVQTILLANGDASLTYAYVLDTGTGALRVADRNDGSGPYHSFAVTNTIDTLNLALDNTPDAVFGSTPRDYIEAGDTVVIQSAGATVNSQIMVDNLTVRATANSADLNLTMAANFANGSAIPGGVNSLTLADYAANAGANVDVTGNALANTITGNSGANMLDGAGGNDTLHGGGGNDALVGGANTDTATYDDARANYAVTMHDDNADGFVDRFSAVSETTVNGTNEGADTLNGVERLVFQSGTPGVPGDDTVYDLTQPIQLIRGGSLIGTFSTIQSAVNAADAGDTVLVNGATQSTFTENVTLSEGITLKGLGTVTVNGAVLVDGGAGGALTIDNIDVNGTGNYAVQVAETSTYTTVAFKNGNITGGNYGGLLLGDGDETGSTTGVGTLVIESANFSGNVVTGSGGGGDGAILLYRYNGNVTLKNVDVTGGANIENGIQIRGAATLAASGTLSFENVDVHGTFARTGVAIRDFLSTTLAFNGSVGNSALDVNVTAGAAYTGLHIDNVGGTVDLSGANAVAAIHYLAPNRGAITMTGLNTAGEIFTADDSNDVLVGLGGNDTLNGGAGFDFIDGGAGSDTIDAGAGTDLIVQTAGQGGGTIQGGTEADTVLLRGTAASDTVTVLYNGSAITSVDGTTLSGVEVVNGTFDATTLGGVLPDVSGGSDTLDYTGSSAGVTVNLATGTASGFAANVAFGLTSAISGFENVTGTGQADSLTGDAGANVLIGAAAADTFTGGGANDQVYGELNTGVAATDNALSTSVKDKAVYAGAIGDFDITINPDGSVTVADTAPGVNGNEATDTLHGVELIELQASGTLIDLTADVRLLDSAGHLVGSFSTVQAAVDAVGETGMKIQLRGGVTFTEQVKVDGLSAANAAFLDDLIIESFGGEDAKIQSPANVVETVRSSSDREVNAVVTVREALNVTIRNVDVDGAGHGDTVDEGGGAGAANFIGVMYRNASGTLTNVDITGVREPYAGGTTVDGFPIVSGNQRGVALQVDNDSIMDFTMTGGTINDFQKNATVFSRTNLNVSGVTVIGGGQQTINAQNGFQVQNSTGSLTGNHFSAFGFPAGTSTTIAMFLIDSTGLTVTGNDYTGTGQFDAGIFLSNVSGSTVENNDFTTARRGIVESGTMTSENNVVNSGATGNSYTGIVTWNHEISSTSNIAFTPDGSDGADRYRTGGGSDVLTGNGGDDFLQARGGVDQMLGGAGNDTIAWTAGDGNDTLIDGGTHTTGDALQVFDTAGADTIQVVTSGSTVVGIGGGLANVQDIESVTLDATAGGTDTLDYTGTTTAVSANLATNVLTGFNSVVAGSTIENVTGGSAGDTLIGSSGANVINGGAGNDQITGAGGNDTLSGGADSDTFNYTVGEGQDTVDGGSTGSDVDTQNIAGTAATETYNINPITGYLGINIETGIADVDATDANYEIGTTEVEEIVITTNGGGDSVIVAGDLAGTGVASSTLRVTGDSGNNIFDASGMTGTPVRVVFDGAGGIDTLKGGAAGDTLIGGDGDDTITGNGGNDTIYGGSDTSDTGTADKAVFSGNSTDAIITFITGQSAGGDGIDVSISSADGNDTTHGIELLQFANGTIDLNANVLVFSSYDANTGTGTLKSSHSGIQSAVNAADADDVVYVRNGTYIEQVTIGAGKSGLTILGQSEAGVIVQAPNTLVANGTSPSNGRSINGVITVDGVNDVSIKNLTVDGALKGGVVVGTNATLVGVAYLSSDDGLIDHVTVTHVREADTGFGNQRNLGIYVSNADPAAPSTPGAGDLAGLNSIEIKNSTITDFQKGGIVVSFADANVHHNTVTGRGVTGLTAQNGIQVAGSTGTVNNNTVTAVGYDTPASIGYAILTFNNRDLVIDTNHVTGTGVATSSGGIAAIGSTGVKVTNNDVHAVIDAIDVYATASFVDPLAPTATSNPGGAFDFSSNAVDADIPSGVFFRPFATSTDTFNVTGTNRDDAIYGATAGDLLTGGAGNDYLEGRGGADTVRGGSDDDTIVWNGGDGSDSIEGGTDTVTGDDTLQVTSNGNLTINGDGTANPSEFTVSVGADTATVKEIEEVAVTLSTGNSLTVSGDFNGTGLNLSTITVTGAGGDETVNASAMTGASAGSPVGIDFTGGGGNDTFFSGVGADAFHGGTGLDTADYDADYTGANVTWDGTTATVTGARGTDTYDSVGKIVFNNKTVWLVSKDAGSDYTEIAQLFDGNPANGEAAAGDVVLVAAAAGGYSGNFSVGVNGVTIKGTEPGVEIVGTFKSANGISGSVGEYLKTATGYITTGDRGLTVAADNVTIDNIKIDGAYVGIELGNGAEHTTIRDVTIEDAVNGVRKGTGAQVTDLDIIRGEIRDSYIGMYLSKETADGLDISDVLIDGTKFTNLTEKGIYAESLALATLTGIIMNNVGQFGRGASFGTVGQFGNGIDLNLKWDFETNTGTTDDNAPYSGITIENFTFTNVGLSNGGGSPHAGGAAIAVKARDTGSYASPEKASFSGAVVIQNGTINGTSVAIRAGEPGQNIADPDVTVTGVTISNEISDVDNVTQSPMTVNMINGGDTLTAAATTTGTLIVNGGTGVDNVTTGGGNDTIKGNAGGDALNGGAGTDTAAYAAAITTAMITQSGGGWQVATGGGEATDTLTNIEIVDGGEAGKFLLVGNGGFATIQAAINAAAAGDTIIVASGTYNESLTIDKALTILGANHGAAGTGPRGPETILNWTTGNAVTVNTTAAVTFDGLKFTGTHVTVASTPDTNITFTDSVFALVSAGNNSNNFYLNQPTSFTFTDNKLDATGYTGALFQPVGTTGNAAHTAVTFTGNTFTGHAGTYVSGDDNNVPLILNLSDVHGTVTGNTFSGVDIGVLVANGAGPLDIGDNTFEHMHRTGPNTGGGLAAGVVFFTPAPFTGTGINIHDNHFNDMDAGVRTSGVPGSTVVGSTITIDDNDFTAVTSIGFQPVGGVLHFTDTTLLPGPTTVPSEFFGGSDNDVITTTAVADIMHGGTGNDTAVYTGTITAANITAAVDTDLNAPGNQPGWQVNATAGGEGIDLLDGMEIVDGLGADKILLVGNGGYATIQAAINASANGDTIIVAAGLYDEDLTIDRAVTIIGAKHGVGGTGVGRDAAVGAGETTIVGHAHVTALGGVTIDGMRFLNDASTTNGGPGNPLLQLASGYNHVVTNSIFYSAVAGGVRPAPDDRAISTPVLATGDITISNNYFTGASTGLFGGSPPASWGRAVWFDGGGVDLHVTGNTIEYSRTGLNLDILGTSDVTVHDNTFKSDGTAIAVGFSENNLVATDNDFQNVGDEFNFRNITENVTFDADVAVDTVTPAVPANPGNDAVFILGGSGNDNLSGTGGVDVIDGNNINAVADTDTLTGRGGNDLLLGRAGADTLDGGAGDDVLDGGTENDTAVYTGTITVANITTVVDADPNTPGDQAGWQVNATAGGEGTDLLNDVEFVDGLGAGKILLVGNGGFATIQEAVNASGANDTILIAGGTYTEQVTVSGHSHDNLKIIAATGATVTVKAPAVLTQTATSGSGRAINGVITVDTATNVQITGIDVDGNGNGNAVVGPTANFIGVAYRNASGGLTNVDVTGVHDAYPGGTTVDGKPIQSGNQRGVGVQVDNATDLAFSMTGGSISDFQKNATVFNHAILSVTGVTITGGGAQTINAQNGFQAANSTGTISGNTISAIGYAGPSVDYSAEILAFNNTGLDITNNIITGTNGATLAAKVVGIYVFDSSGGTISGNSVDRADVGIGIYDGITPSGILVTNNTVTNVDITDASAAGVDFEPTAALAVNYSVDGSAAADILFGAAGADTLNGLGAADLIEGRGGADTLNGGTGNDVFIIGAAADHAVGEVIDGGGDTDVIRFTSSTAGETLTLRAGVTNIAEIEISDSAGLNTGTVALNIDGSAAGGNYTLTGNDGANNLKGGSGSNTINAGSGNDTVIGTADSVADTYRGDAGTDTIDYSALVAGQDISINLGSGGASGTAIGSDGLVSIENATAGGGDDSVFGSLLDNVLRGGGGADNIVGDGGNDQLFGDAGDDTLNGGTNDFGLTPAAANDVLWGGTGDDTFKFEGRFGADAIGAAGNADWVDGEDMVFVGYSAFAPIIVAATDGVLITVNDGSVSSTVFVAGATTGQMQTQISGLDLIIH